MKFKLIKDVAGEVNCYGTMCKTGGTFEVDGRLAERAQSNPDFQEVKKRGPAKKVVKNDD